MGHSTLNVEPKYLTSSIFLKFCGQLPLAIKWWHAKFENDRITFRALFGRDEDPDPDPVGSGDFRSAGSGSGTFFNGSGSGSGSYL